MSMIFTRAPLRISLGGGGTDIPSYYRDHGGFLVSGAIDKYVYMLTHTVFQKRYRMKYSEFEEVDEPQQIKHPILRESLLRHWAGNPLEIASLADVPAGTGLGSSGAYTVCLLKALALGRRNSITPGALAEDACEIKIDVLGEPSGKQDQYVAAHEHDEGVAEVYNLGTNETIVVDDSVALITQHMGVDPEIEHSGGLRGWPGDSPLIVLDCSKLRRLGWEPQLNIEQALERTLDWLDSNTHVFEEREPV